MRASSRGIRSANPLCTYSAPELGSVIRRLASLRLPPPLRVNSPYPLSLLRLVKKLRHLP